MHSETNRLLRAVKADLQVKEYVAGMRALGLVCKFVVAPLWQVLEQKGEQHMSILEMSRTIK